MVTRGRGSLLPSPVLAIIFRRVYVAQPTERASVDFFPVARKSDRGVGCQREHVAVGVLLRKPVFSRVVRDPEPARVLAGDDGFAVGRHGDSCGDCSDDDGGDDDMLKKRWCEK